MEFQTDRSVIGLHGLWRYLIGWERHLASISLKTPPDLLVVLAAICNNQCFLDHCILLWWVDEHG